WFNWKKLTSKRSLAKRLPTKSPKCSVFLKKIFVQSIKIIDFFYSIHDDVKDKPFDLELSWVLNDSKKLILLCSFVYLIGALKVKKIHVWTSDRHSFVPQDVLSQAKDAGVKAI
ncbi:hypothetical protein RFI_32005, partial [Reticulomyxa filosa]